MNYFTSDTHFNHVNILQYCRPQYADPDAMNWDMVKTWNATVTPDDTVFHMGDYAFKTGQKKEETRNLTANLHGKIHLKQGNHDNLKQIGDFPFEIIEYEGFAVFGGVKFRMAHYPYPWGRTQKDLDERPECKTEPDVDPDTGELYPLLCGHVHDKWAMQKGCLNVGWDIWKRPLSEAEVLRLYHGTRGFQELTGLGDLIRKVLDKTPD